MSVSSELSSVILQNSDLIGIPLRYRDASVHYYNTKTDEIESYDMIRKIWYTCQYADDIKFQYLHPDEYKKLQDMVGVEAKYKCIEELKYMQKYKPVSELFKWKDNKIKIDREFIDKLIENKHFYYYLIDKIGKTCGTRTPFNIEKAGSENLCVPIITETRKIPSRNHDFIFDIKTDEETYITINNNAKLYVDKNTVLCMRSIPNSHIEFNKDVSYSCLSSNALMHVQTKILFGGEKPFGWEICSGVLVAIK